ncbi:GNAT family N-acetyltransferase [Streptomyces sp. SID8352]|nr:GNAT family N-acetyltransferase [Streptomyces sp. SID8352]
MPGASGAGRPAPGRPASGSRPPGGAALDDPVRTSLRGNHAALARWDGRAGTYAPGAATFCTVPAVPDPADWAGLARLLGPGGLADMFSCPAAPPADWEPVFTLEGRQMVRPDGDIGRASAGGFDGSAGRPPVPDGPEGPRVVELGAADVPEMLGLVALTAPGPFGPRTHRLGTYLGVRDGGRLVAMAGERLRPPGWTEISAVCTAPGARGRGYAGLLVDTLAARITARGERPFLHVAEANAAAIALYERLGFALRARVVFRGFRVP